MNIKDRMIIEEYRQQKPNFNKIEEIVELKLKQLCKQSGSYINAIQHRVKEENV